MSTENASALAEGQDLPADTSQQNATGAESQEQQLEKTFTQAELDAIVQKRAAKEARKAEARYAALEAQIHELKTPKAAPESQPDKAPKREEFSSYEDFVEARALHVARAEAKKELEAFKNESKKEKESNTRAQAQREFEAKRDQVIAAGQKAFPDFDAAVNDAVDDGLIPVSGPLYEAIMDSDMGEKLVYHLAKNPSEAERINKLGPLAQIRELGKLEDKLSAKKEPRETMEPIGGRTSTATGLRDDLPMDAWIKQRNKQIKESRGP
jgi:hypothetical protein